MLSLEESQPKQLHMRSYKACLNCRTRKVKCDLGSVDAPRSPPCARCVRERRDCVFGELRRGGYALVAEGKRRRMEQADAGLESPYAYPPSTGLHLDRPLLSPLPLPPIRTMPLHMNPEQPLLGASRSPPLPANDLYKYATARKPSSLAASPASDHKSISSFLGALLFLANAVGEFSREDERDKIDAKLQLTKLEESALEPAMPTRTTSTDGSSNGGTNAHSGAEPGSSARHSSYSIPREVPEVRATHEDVRPAPQTTLLDIYYIGSLEKKGNVLTVAEAEWLINCFFAHMHPFFPHIPERLHEPLELAGHPLLLGAILTISARYHLLEQGVGSALGSVPLLVPRNMEVHDRLWVYVQRLISQTVWSEALTRSMGTVFAFLLFTEWNPRAIHWRWTDYANKPDILLLAQEVADTTAAAQSSDESEVMLTGLGALRRLDRMAWMLIGSAVRLAQDMGFMESEAGVFLATHILETTNAMSINKRLMLTPSLSEIDLGLFEEGDVEAARPDGSRLQFLFIQRAKIELLQVVSIGYEYLYGRDAKLNGLTHQQNLAVLGILLPLLEKWASKYNLLLESNSKGLNRKEIDPKQPNSRRAQQFAQAVDIELVIFDYHYTRLYIYLLALSHDMHSGRSGALQSFAATQAAVAGGSTTSLGRFLERLRLSDLSRLAKYVLLAFHSAKEMLAAAQRTHRLRLLRFMPVRWCTRIVQAVAFAVKCYLTLTAAQRQQNTQARAGQVVVDLVDTSILLLLMISADELFMLIQRAAITLREALPDELHLCSRYLTILMYLCSQVKLSNTAPSPPPAHHHHHHHHRQRLDLQWQLGEEPLPVSASSQTKAEAFMDPLMHPAHAVGDAPVRTSAREPAAVASHQPRRPRKELLASSLGHVPGASTGSGVPAATGPQQAAPQFATADDILFGLGDIAEWFMNNGEGGLEFVDQWTEMLELSMTKHGQGSR